MAEIAWKDQYKHPMWQKRRLEALEAARYSCQRCGDEETTLHVHHKRYAKGRHIWEYDLSELSVLCEPCHGSAHVEKEMLQSVMSKLHPEGVSDVISLIAGYCNNVNGPCHIDLNGHQSLELSRLCAELGKVAAIVQNLSLHDIERVLSFVWQLEDESRK